MTVWLNHVATKINQASVTFNHWLIFVDERFTGTHVAEEVLTLHMITTKSGCWWEAHWISSCRRRRWAGTHKTSKDIGRVLVVVWPRTLVLTLIEDVSDYKRGIFAHVELARVLQETRVRINESNFSLHFVRFRSIWPTKAHKSHWFAIRVYYGLDTLHLVNKSWSVHWYILGVKLFHPLEHLLDIGLLFVPDL